MNCRICQTPSATLFTAKVMGKHDVRYFACPHCGFVQTEDPFWLEEAYASPISLADVGLVGRNIGFSQFLRKLITAFLDPAASFVDYGGGNGMLVRLMRDHGFDFRWHDKYATNLFARGHEHQPGTRYELLTAFEVFEHLVDPRAEVAAMSTFSDRILFSTELIPNPPPDADAWSYYGLPHGQHVAFYTARSLELLGRELGFRYASLGAGLHLLSKQPINRFLVRVLCLHRLSNLRLLYGRRPSLVPQDWAAAIAQLSNSPTPPEPSTRPNLPTTP